MAGISVALSGGGHRAALFGLGALLYLVDAGKNSEVSSIASVSGGSLTNAYIAQELDFKATDSDHFRATIKPFVALLAQRGTVFASGVTKLYLGLLLLIAAGLMALFVSLFAPLAIGISDSVKGLLLGAGIFLWGGLARARGKVCGRAFRDLLFSRSGSATQLSEIEKSIDHVICATDLHAGEHVYFSGRFVYGYRFGWGTPGVLPLHVPVQASAALPGAFAPRWVPTSDFSFKDPQDERARDATHLVLADGGVYDNMGDQWGQGTKDHNSRRPAHTPALHEPDELIVVNSSAGLGFKSTASLRLPLIGELFALLRDKDVLYDNGTSVRRQALVARFDLAAREGVGLAGALVHIPQTPLKVARFFGAKEDSWPDRAGRASAVIAKFDSDEAQWKDIAAANSEVKTTLSKMTPSITARLLRQGYALATANLHVVLGYPLLDVPPVEHFESLAL